MAKPAYSLVYAILIAVGLLALVLFNRLLGSEEASPAAQASLQRNEETAREARDAVAEDGKAEKADTPVAREAEARGQAATAEAREEEDRK